MILPPVTLSQFKVAIRLVRPLGVIVRVVRAFGLVLSLIVLLAAGLLALPALFLLLLGFLILCSALS